MWILAVLVLVLTWGVTLGLRVIDVAVPTWIPVLVTVLTVLTVVGLLVWRKVRANVRAKQLEREILRQSEQQAAQARPDRRAEILELQKQVLTGIAALKNTKVGKGGGANALYALPWYVIIGPPGAGKTTALKHSGLVFPHLDPNRGGVRGIGGTRNCDWWFTNEGILLDTAGRYATEDDDREEWLAFLAMMRKYRPRKPLNGLLVAVAVSDLVEASEEQIVAQARTLRARVDEIMTRLDMVLPVYLTFTKADLIGGFSEFYGDLRKSERDQLLGATLPLEGMAGKDPGELFRERFETIVSVTHARALRMLGRERRPEVRGKLYDFPLELKALSPNLEQFVRTLFQQNAFQENPIFRGFYLTSGTQEGRPFERVIGGMARAFGIRPPDFYRAPTESKSYFVTDVFRQVVFPDQNIAGRTTAELRRQSLTRGIIAGAATLIGLLLLGPALPSFGKNKDLLREGQATSLEAKTANWQEPGAVAPKVAKLDASRALLHKLDGWHEDGAPWSMRWGLYVGEELREALRDSYTKSLAIGLEKPSRGELELHLTALGRMNEVPSHQYASQYNALKLYLMLTDRSRLDVAWATPRLRDVWAKALRTNDDKAAQAMLPHTQYYLELMKRGDILPWPADAQTTSRARTVLLRAPAVERMYEVLVRDANARVAPIRRETVFYGSVAPFVTGRENVEVQGAYTKEGWAHVRTLLGQQSSQLTDESWVLGEKQEQSAQEVKKQIERLRETYFGRYKKAWRDFLLDLKVERPEDGIKSLDELNALSEPEWPYQRLLRTLHENVALDVSEHEVAPSTERLIQAAKREVKERITGKETPAEAVKPERPMSEVERAFLPLTRFAIGPEGKEPAPTGLTEYQGLLAKLVGVLTDLRDADTSPKTKEVANEFQQAYRATSALLSNQDGFTRPMLEPLLMRPIAGAWAGVANDAGGAASGLWEMSVWEKWHESLEPVYPFADSPKDAKLKDFTDFFGPQKGALWAFYEENLSGSIQRSGNSFTAARRFDSGVNYEAQFLDKCLSKGAEVTQTVFGDGAEPVIEFEVNLHSVSPNVSEVRLSIDGNQHVYRNTPEEWLQSQWPAKEAETPGARVRIRGLRQLDEEIIRDGDFGFFRMLDAATSIEPDPAAGDDGRTLIATWDLPSEKAFFKLHVRTKRRDVKLGSQLFRDVACPRVIATVAK